MSERRSRATDNRSTDFQRRYDPNFSWKTLQGVFSALPGLRAGWTMGAFDETGDVYGVSTLGTGRILDYNGNPQFGAVGLAPYIALDGTGDYLNAPDDAGLDITGLETYVVAANSGLTMGCWVYPTSVAGVQAVMGKWDENGVDERSYLIDLNGTAFRARISNDGTAGTLTTVSSTVTAAVNHWYCVQMSYDPSARLMISVNGTVTETVAGVIASLHPGSADLYIGTRDGGAALLTGRVGMAYLTCMYYEDATTPTDHMTQSIFHHTRALYGV